MLGLCGMLEFVMLEIFLLLNMADTGHLLCVRLWTGPPVSQEIRSEPITIRADRIR